MPTTRSQAALHTSPHKQAVTRAKPASKSKKSAHKKYTELDEKPEAVTGDKREAEETDQTKDEPEEQPPVKKAKAATEGGESESADGTHKGHPLENSYQPGVIERGHVYFFYRPRVEVEEVHSEDDIQRFHILFMPRPPEFSVVSEPSAEGEKTEESEMTLLSEGADAVPAPEPTNKKKKQFRLVTIGKKSLPDPDAGGGHGKGRKATFWGTVTTVGEDLEKLADGLGPKQYETKTKGTRHQGPARLAARGAYAFVNTDASMPSQRETHLGYHLSHPTPEHLGDLHSVLGIHEASSFIIQVKNPLAPPTGPSSAGLPSNKRAEYPEEIMVGVFGKGGSRGREKYGLRFASVERKELLDYEGTELLFIAARSGEGGLERSLGEGRGNALTEVEEKESHESVQTVLKELGMEKDNIPALPLEGSWQ